LGGNDSQSRRKRENEIRKSAGTVVNSTTVALSKTEAEDFVAHENRLLDEWRLDEWSALFTDDGIYWLPGPNSTEPSRETAIIFDDGNVRKIRIRQLILEHLAQMPRSETVHLTSNYSVDADANGNAIVLCSFVVYETRPSSFAGLDVGRGVVRPLPGHLKYSLVSHEGSWRIQEKRVTLIARNEPQYNLTFII
jgi:3-phenylpropionate/cinnamic acid dioxygenase small subunit